MAEARRFRPAHLIALVLLAPPIYKLAEWAWPSAGPKKPSVRAVAAGRDLFEHEWSVNDPLSSGDGLGPVFNARSCVACHSQGGPGGGGPVEHNVTVYGLSPTLLPKDGVIPPIGVVHSHAIKPEFQEFLRHVNPALPGTPSIALEHLIDRSRTVFPTGITVTQRNTPALFGDGLLDAIPEDSLHAEQRRNSELARFAGLSRAKDSKIRGRVARLPNGRLGRFGWKAEFASLDDFVRAACANELGLSNPTRSSSDLARSPRLSAEGDRPERRPVRLDRRLPPRSSRPGPGDPGRAWGEGSSVERGRSFRLDRLRRLPYARPRPDSRFLLEPPAPRHGLGDSLRARDTMVSLPRLLVAAVRMLLRSPTSGGPRRSGAWPTPALIFTTAERRHWNRRSPFMAERHPTSPPGFPHSPGWTRTI